MATIETQVLSSLESLPSEIADMIAEELDLPSVCNLRLTRKVFSSGCYIARFRSFFKHQKTSMTSKSLQRLGQIAEHPILGSAVQSLVVLAVVYNVAEPEWMLRTGRHRYHRYDYNGLSYVITERFAREDVLEEARLARKVLLKESQQQRKMSIDKSDLQLLVDGLRSLGAIETLQIEGVDVAIDGAFAAPEMAHEWHPMWIRASRVYRVVMLAICHSGIAIEHLKIYSTCRRCSIQTRDINEYMPELENANFASAAKHIKSFSLSVSTRVDIDLRNPIDLHDAPASTNVDVRPRRRFLTERDESAVAEENFPGIARLLKYMPNLEHLDLHLYRTLLGSVNSYTEILTHIANDVHLPSLRHCVLRGLPADKESLNTFLENHSKIETLELRQTSLVSGGTWAQVFSKLHLLPSLQRVTLQNLFMRYNPVNLAPVDIVQEEIDYQTSFRCEGGIVVHTRTFSRNDNQEERFEWARALQARLLNARALDSPALDTWENLQVMEYGPPPYIASLFPDDEI